MPPFFFSSSSLHLPSSSHLSKLFHLSSSFQHHSTRYHRRNHTMACVCGCDRDDHLHNLQSGSPSFSSAFKEPGGPSFDEKLTNRFQLNQEEIEPSKSIPRRPKDGGDAQSQECAKSPNPFDSNRSPLSLPLPRLEELTSGDQMTKDALMQDWHRDSDNPRGAQKPRRTSNVEQAFQVLWPLTKGVMRASSFERRKMISSFSLPNTLAQPSAKLKQCLWRTHPAQKPLILIPPFQRVVSAAAAVTPYAVYVPTGHHRPTPSRIPGLQSLPPYSELGLMQLQQTSSLLGGFGGGRSSVVVPQTENLCFRRRGIVSGAIGKMCSELLRFDYMILRQSGD